MYECHSLLWVLYICHSERTLEDMFDSQVLELEREVMELKIANTNLLYNKKALNNLVTVKNTGLTEVCKCKGCYLAKRF